MFTRIDRLLRLHRSLPYVAICISMAIVVCIDYLTGPEFSTFTFYLVPVGLTAWYTRKSTTVAVILLATITWMICQKANGKVYHSELAPYWNAGIRFITFMIVGNLLGTVRRSLRAMTDMAMKDGLTGLDNARAFRSKYHVMRGLALRRRNPLAIALIDLDGFKGVNDRNGHAAGDEVLKQFARVLVDASRSSDVVARLGGDEFAVLLADANERSAQVYDARLRQEFAKSGLAGSQGIDFSMGVVVFDAPPLDVNAATAAADSRMYAAKLDGKSRTVIEPAPAATASPERAAV